MKYEYLKEYKTNEGYKAVYLGKDDDGDDMFATFSQLNDAMICFTNCRLPK